MSEPREDDNMMGCSIMFALVILWGVVFYLNYRTLNGFENVNRRLDAIEKKLK